MYGKQLTVFFVSLLALVLASPLQAEPGRQAAGEELNSEKSGDDIARKPRVPTFAIEGDLAGELSVISTRYEDTFAAIGNRDSLGYLELVKANPGVDPWLPGEGTRITLPRHYVLPDVKREGIVINLAEYRLYYFTENGVQVYPVGVGTEDNPSPLTDAEVTMPLESPAWYPPASIRAEYEADGDYLPRMIPPGPDNPLGSHALMLSEKGYLIHGTNKLFGVGMQVSHGCFRMYNEDISRFVYQVSKGTPVRVIREPVKIGMKGNEVWLEVHRPEEQYSQQDREKLWHEVSRAVEEFRSRMPGVEVQRMAIELALDQADGLPRMIGERVTRVANETTEPAYNTPDSEEGREQRLWF
ncbi:L,D-transpeptidase family protein [Marinobacter sp. TBZ242]|uniref:L,D-transpeptidase family protein n=1 Tax=Marinobacter azerbaijanicus TaxID=3050455 RepID=A0ABT7IHU7_9GAMM|nr:L,D-transpeptidase family protein [Marinobacter sp. TBZ242]MDL0432723.1 L,D-transpeptidase family protein [Marinobacter sp. TBZ242]